MADALKYEFNLDWDDVLEIDDPTDDSEIMSPGDALIKSMAIFGRVDIEYIKKHTEMSFEDIKKKLGTAIFQDPEIWDGNYEHGWVIADEYLSGNLYHKREAAYLANRTFKGLFSRNIRAINEVMPEEIESVDIHITLGSPWVPTFVIDDFIYETFGDPKNYSTYEYEQNNKSRRRCFKTKHNETTGSWEIVQKERYRHNIAMTQTYGTKRLEALHIIEKTLNMKPIIVYDTVGSGKYQKKVINHKETMAAVEKQELLVRTFKDWVWKDEKRAKLLKNIYEEKYACIKRRVFDGSFLEFPNLNKETILPKHEKDAIARILFTPNTLLAHNVGAGKTYVMIAAGEELLRMKMSKKNMYVVPNNITGQWMEIYKTMYPNANILLIEPRNFTPDKREKACLDIKNGGYSTIIIAASCFEMIPVSKESKLKEIDAQIWELEETPQSEKTKSSIRRCEELKKARKKIVNDQKADKCKINFDDMGITRLFIDEAHNYKNITVKTQSSGVHGVSVVGSAKCDLTFEKVRIVQKQNNGKGVVMATGTPITNSITEVFVLQKYLQNAELELMNIQSFDSWIGMFAEPSTDYEIDVDSNTYKLTTRYAKFHNLAELTAMLSCFADFYRVEKSENLPDFDGYQDVLITKDENLKEYLEQISKRVEFVHKGGVDPKEDNLLKITSDGRKAALDLRLVGLSNKNADTKAKKCAEKVAEIYFATENEKLTQIIFCDFSTPKKEFNMYDEIKSLLIDSGVPESQIAFIHDCTSERARKKLFGDVNAGRVRVVLGSTEKLGVGVNVQQKLVAIHHLDLPWRPSDMVQREGRILRQGNENEKVAIYRYVTEGSFDAYSWQLLETKQRFISSLLAGSLKERNGSDIDDTVLNYAEVKALAIGNPLIKERVSLANEVTKLSNLKRKFSESIAEMENEISVLPKQIDELEDKIEKCKRDNEFYDRLIKEGNAVKTERLVLREKIAVGIAHNAYTKSERLLFRYHGFDVKLPTDMNPEDPYLIVENHGRYRLDLGDKEVGYMIRLDNFFDNLPAKLEELQQNANRLKTRKQEIITELKKQDDYSLKIEELNEKIKQLDDEIGGKK